MKEIIFGLTLLTSLISFGEVPGSTEHIEPGAFSSLISLEQVDLSNASSPTTPTECFQFAELENDIIITAYFQWRGDECTKDVSIPSHINGKRVTTIGYKALNELGLTSLKLPNTITLIEGYACSQNNIKDLVIPSSVIFIGYGAFLNNPQLSKLTLSGQLKVISNRAFRDTNLSTIEVFHLTQENSDSFDDDVEIVKKYTREF
ncbi:MAG: leucine-rich repeat domain-containing protein [Bdellovibrionaceae bacterium]|jgi:hypothetical protein|nr:leucine-rich repeat domain-containing protein [Pseudobdellovibrionaceae bacterium]